jgi:hypothetical protein
MVNRYYNLNKCLNNHIGLPIDLNSNLTKSHFPSRAFLKQIVDFSAKQIGVSLDYVGQITEAHTKNREKT